MERLCPGCVGVVRNRECMGSSSLCFGNLIASEVFNMEG